MSIEIKLPEISEGVTSVDIAEIRVSEGDVIEAGTVLCEVETDKAVADVPSPQAGRVARVLVKAGDSVTIGTPLFTLDAVGDNGTAARETSPRQTSAPRDPEPPIAAQDPATATKTTAPAPPAPPVADAAMAETEQLFPVPEISEGIARVDVAAVTVQVGDVVTRGQAIAEVETDKAVAEIVAPAGGTIRALHIAPGQNVAVGDPLVTILTTAAPVTTPATGSRGATAATVAPAAATTATSAADVTAAAVKPPRRVATAPPTTGRPPAPAGPATRRLARKLGVDLYQVSGTASGGRITIEDVEAWVRDRLSQPGVPTAAAAPGLGAVAAAPLPDFSKFGPVEKQSLSKIYRTAAANLHAAWVTIPHVTQHDLADITELEAARRRYIKTATNAPKITMTAIMIKAVVSALKAFPSFNASIDMTSGELILKHYYNVGVAVDTPNGLVVPVIRNCDQKNVLQVASELTDIAGRARDRKLKTEDMQGGTFTITNLGGIGGTYFTPIVNYPEVAILGMSRGQTQLVLEEGQIVERLMLPLSLSYDHRAVNGADAARFIVKLSSSLSNFFELF